MYSKPNYHHKFYGFSRSVKSEIIQNTSPRRKKSLMEREHRIEKEIKGSLTVLGLTEDLHFFSHLTTRGALLGLIVLLLYN